MLASACATNASSDVPPPPPPQGTLSPTPSDVWTNGDFESDPIGTTPPTGWTVATGLNPGITDLRPASQTLASLDIGAGGTSMTYVVGGVAPESQLDPDLGSNGTLRYPKYGLRAARLNYASASSNGDNRNLNTMTQTMTVGVGDVDPTDNNVHVRFAVAPILENPNHTYTEQPYYFVRLQNLTKNLTVYQDFNASGQPGVPWKNFTDSSGQAAQYTDWQLVDISPGNAQLAVGDQVQLTVIAAGCSQGGHWGRLYVDSVGSGIPGLYAWSTGPQEANAGTTITYAINYKNGSTVTTTGTQIDFTTPPNTTYTSTTAAGCTAVPAVGGTGTLTCPVGTLAPGATGSYSVTVTIPAVTATGTVITNGTYQIYATGVSALIGPKVETTVTSGASYADLGVTLTDGVAALGWLQPTTYTLTVTNAGPLASTALVTDAMPAQLATMAWTCAATGGGSCGVAGVGGISDAISLPVGATATYTINAAIIAGTGSGSVIDIASVATTGAVSDPNTTNNTAVDTDAIGTLRTLSLTKSGAALAGSVASVPAAVVCGLGCTAASGTFLDSSQVVLAATPIAGATFVGWSGACSGTAPTCTVTMAGDQSVTASFVGAPAAIAVSAGGGQTARVSTAYALPLAVLVTDGLGLPVPGATVTFSAPSSGASAVLSATTATTNALGVAQVTATATAAAGAFSVGATVGGVTAGAAFALDNVGAPASIAFVSGAPQSATVGAPFGASLVAVVTDAASQPVPGVTVTFAAPASGATASLVAQTVTTDANGLATDAATAGTIAGAYSVTAAVGGVATPASFALANTAGQAALLSIVGGGAQSAIVGTAFVAPLQVRLVDGFGNAVAGAAIAFSAPSSGASCGLGTPTATDATGLAQVAATANTAAGGYSVTASFGALASVQLALTNLVGPAATIVAVSGGGQSATVGAAFAQPLRALVADRYGNPVAGAPVAFTAPLSGASATIGAAITDVTGVASAAATATTAAGAYSVSAITVGAAAPATFALTNTAGTAASIAVSGGSSQSARVGVPFAQPLRATVTDSYGNPIAGAQVAFTAPSSGASTVPASLSATTSASGVAIAVLTANATAGGYSVSATTAGVAVPALFALTNAPGAPAAIAIASGDAQHATVGTPFAAPLVVTVTDAYGNTVPSASVSFAAAAASISGSPATTGSSGQAQVTATAGNVAGSCGVVAAIPGAQAVFSLTCDPGAPAAIAVVSGSPQSAAVGAAFGASLVARVTDAHGNAVPSASVAFAAPSSGATAQLSAPSATTDASGQVSFTATAGHAAGAYSVTATVGAVAPAAFALTNTAGAVATLVATGGNGQSAVALAPFAQPLAVHAADQYGNAVGSASIAFAEPASGPTATAAGAALTDGSGDASVSATAGGVAGGYSVTASAGSAAPVTFALTNLAGSAASISVLDGDDQSTTVASAFLPLRAIVRDATGNTVAGATVTFAGPAAPATATPLSPTATSDAGGIAAVTAVASTHAGSYALTASIAAGAQTSFSLTNTAGPPGSITALPTGSPQAMTALLPFAQPLGVLVADHYGNPVAGAVVAYTAPLTGPTAALAAGSAATGSDGTASVLATAGGEAGACDVLAAVPGVADAAPFALTNLAGAPATLALAGGSAQSATVDTDFAQPLAALVLDANGNPVTGAVVTFTAPATPATAILPASSALTDATGTATLTAHASTVSGGYAVVASLEGVAAPIAFALTNQAGSAATIAPSASSTPQSAQVGTTFVAPLVALVSDGFGNPVPGATVAYAVPATGATGALGSASAITGADGRAAVAITAGTGAGAFAASASTAGVAAPALFALTDLAGPAHTITAYAGGGQSATVGSAFAAPLDALVVDTDGNPVAGVDVTFATTGSAAIATPTVATDETGHATTLLAAGTLAGDFAVTAVADGGAAPAAFPLTAVAGAPAAIAAAASASPQTEHVLGAFAQPLAVTVSDAFGNRVAGATVAYAAPSEPGAVLSAGSATTDALGDAQVLATADGSAGSYQVTASVAGLSATFALANTAAAATHIVVTGGGAQHAMATRPFGAPIALRVVDDLGNPVAGVPVAFSMPTAGATATVDSGAHVSDATGAVTATLVAGALPGGFTLAASAPGVLSPGTTTLVVDAIPTVTTPTLPADATADAAIEVAVQVTAPYGTPSGTVAIKTASGTQLATAVLANGTATVSVPAQAIGAHQLVAVYAGGGSYGPSTSAASAITVGADAGSLSGGGCSAGRGGVGWLVVLAALGLVVRKRRRGAARVAVVAGIAAVGVLALGRVALADPLDGDRAIDRYHAASPDSLWFSLDSGSFTGNREVALSAVGDYADQPLRIYNADGSVRQGVVSTSLVVQIGASVTLFDRLRLSATAPMAVVQDGTGGTYDGMTLASPTFAFGDVSAAGDVRVLGGAQDPLRVVAGLELVAPTGSRTNYTSDGEFAAQPRVTAAGSFGALEYAATLGALLRGKNELADQTFGSELRFSAAAGVRLVNAKLLVGPELIGATSLVRGTSTGTPLELGVGAHYAVARGLRVGLGITDGMINAIGVPSWRGLASLTWTP